MNKQKTQEKSRDPYTGEITREAEDAGQVIEVVPVDTGERKGKDYLLNEETSMDMIAADENADAVAQRAARYTQDKNIEEVFEHRQELASGGREVLEEELEEHHAESPELTGGDLDASWQSANASGEESIGGTTPTPDQDVVGELGKAVGLTYHRDEPLGSEDKFLERDRDRYELNPESGEEGKDTDQ